MLPSSLYTSPWTCIGGLQSARGPRAPFQSRGWFAALAAVVGGGGVCCAGSRSLARVPPATDGRGHTVGMGETRDVLSLFRDALGILPPAGRERLRGRAPGVCALRPLGETGPVRGLWWMASPSPRLACDAAWMTRLPRTTARPSIGFSIVFILCAFTGSDAGCK